MSKKIKSIIASVLVFLVVGVSMSSFVGCSKPAPTVIGQDGYDTQSGPDK